MPSDLSHLQSDDAADVTDGKRNDNEYFVRLYKKRKEEQAAAIASAKEEARAKGKEPFDMDQFDELYGVSDPKTGYVPSADVAAEYEERYYCYHPEIMTMREFADFLQDMEGWN